MHSRLSRNGHWIDEEGDACGCDLCQLKEDGRKPLELIKENPTSPSVSAPTVSTGEHTGERRVVDPTTGGMKGQKLQRFSLIPAEFLWELATHYGKGARKYDDRNWEKGYRWSLSLDAHGRHLGSFLGTSTAPPQRYDPETGTHHLIAAIWHLISVYIYDLRGLGTDDVRQNCPRR